MQSIQCMQAKLTDEAERIVRDNLFGIDKDEQAVEVAKLNLWLKLLKSNPQTYTRSESRAPARLPDLIGNIHVRDRLQDSQRHTPTPGARPGRPHLGRW